MPSRRRAGRPTHEHVRMSIDARIAALAPPWVRALVPYPIEQPGELLKLDAMENPYPLPASLAAAWRETIAQVPVNRYPDPDARALKQALTRVLALPDGIGITLGNGSDEIIHLLCLALARGEGAVVLCPEPSFSVYRIAAQALGIRYQGVPLRAPDFGLDLPAMLAAIACHQPAVLFLASPNNPTANRLDDDALAALCAASPGVVVLDEAYYRFSGPTRVAEVLQYENLLVMHTLSKIGLAGLRVGALFAQTPWIELIERLRMPYNISALSQAGALFALDHLDAFEAQIRDIVDSRGRLQAALVALPRVEVWPSETNFILFRVPAGRGPTVFAALKHAGVLVKNVDGAHPALRDCLRVTVGTDDENGMFLQALGKALTDTA